MDFEHIAKNTPNLASRILGASVMFANDESFGEKENLVLDSVPDFTPGLFGHKGEIVDGWETRRRRVEGFDWAIIRLGAPGTITAIDVDTSFFTGNFPSSCWVEATSNENQPGVEELTGEETKWVTLVPETNLVGGTHNWFEVSGEFSSKRFTHLRLNISPDGGVARLRAFGDVVINPVDVGGLTVDLASRNLGGRVISSSNDFFSNAHSLNMPNLAQNMGDGWETARRRTPGKDWAIIRLAAPGILKSVEVDTSYYVYNASKEFSLHALSSEVDPKFDAPEWKEIIPVTRLRPDNYHRIRIDLDQIYTHVRIDVFPDGGISRLRLVGEVSDIEKITSDYLQSLPMKSHLLP
jgi:allantoicase